MREDGTPHEVGHFLDHKGLGKSPDFWTDSPDELKEIHTKLLRAWQNSKSIQELQKLDRLATDAIAARESFFEITDGLTRGRFNARKTKKYVGQYLLTRTEVFARSYAQYIATKSGHATMLKQLEQGLSKGYSTQWTAKDFREIEKVFDELFEAKGWI